MSQESRYRKIARECYERVMRGAKGRFDIEDVKDELRDEIAANGLDADAIDFLVEDLIRREDEARGKAPRHVGQLDLLTEDEVASALDVVWKLDGGERVQAKYANRADHLRRLGVKKQNLDAVQDAYARDKREYDHLAPYYLDDTTTYADALAAWFADNSQEDTP
ncbi:MAG TPA: hypothetical protein VIU37_11605 [Candidatus Limnocylindrales bacterium]